MSLLGFTRSDKIMWVGHEMPVWEQRFRATHVSFPQSARDAPHRCVYFSNASGTTQLYAWDRQKDRHTQLTRRPEGVRDGMISPDGEWVWWFDDSAGDECGHWVRQRFDSPEVAEPATPALPDGYPVGLALGRTCAVVGLSDRSGVRMYVQREGENPPALVYSSPRYATVQALSYDESLLAIEHSEHGDAFHPAIRVFRLGGDRNGGVEIVGECWDGPGLGLTVGGFPPCPRDARLLVHHERQGRSEPLIWDLASGDTTRVRIDLDGELTASWYPDGRALLVRRHWRARDELYRFDLASRELRRIETPTGVVHGCAVRRDGTVEYATSSGARPSLVMAAPTSGAGHQVLTSPKPAPPSVPLEDAWVEGPGGPIHALVARPPSASGRLPTVFWLHGGPGGEMVDSFFAIRSAFVDAGYAVVHVNYRGSAGYGAAWRDALQPRPGLVELEDVAAVQDWAIDSGLADAERCLITGKSWGGYLTLLALGVQPERWAAGIADVPIGDLVALYEDEMEPVREHDRSLFGGTPEELPEKWARSSPITYVDRVKAPLLVIASRNDPRCPIRSVDNYLARLDELGTAYEVYRFEAGHFSVVVDEQVKQMQLQLDFCRRVLA
ncbi:MAG TPA: prolyl oligopeptidase family serine peptidase [Actinopolymorphaceae bacterium]